MNRFPFIPISATLLPLVGAFTCGQSAVMAQSALHLAYPPNNHETTASQIFLIGTAPPSGTVRVNGQTIARSSAGHFAPSFPLQLGTNQFTLNYGNQQMQLTVIRLPAEPPTPVGATFAPDSITPAVDLARLPNEPICFSAIAPANATVSVKLVDQTIPLEFQPQRNLPPNSAVLTGQNQPVATSAGKFQGCVRTVLLGDLGKPEFQLALGDRRNSQVAPGSIRILSPEQLEVAEVTAEAGTARTGPSTDYSRLTPLPKGTQAVITGMEGDWLRLDYGAWIRRSEVQIRKTSVPPNSLIRSVKARQVGDWTEVVFPLQVPVPVSVQQGDRSFTLTLHNTTAQTDTIKLDDDPLISRLDWQQTAPGQVEYKFNLKTTQQWGYTLRYEGTSLVLSLKHPPKVNRGATNSKTALAGVKILLDPGHGGEEDTGATSPTGYPEKDMTLIMSKLVRDRLVQRGATVVMTREADIDVPLQDRVNLIQKTQPAIALSVHYNALPDDGDALKTQGVSAFWYHAQAHSLAVFLHNYLVKTLNRPSDGVFWNNLALTRPANTPSVLLELGFMINPTEFEWIMNPQEQQRLATAIADGITEWVRQAK
ncbi:N-acetylmuramoyl-L-alanine amidase [Pantanalinema rosaneae CENA516]|uniref:N-acetylmuramoyl-L-alanine amidase n=1 Tax=Pantanalinema rosaneae TaxID=1620701 RepID=UPI003D6E9A6A